MIDFRYPVFLLVIIPGLILWLVWERRTKKQHLLIKDSAPEILESLMAHLDNHRKNMKNRLFFLGLTVLIVAASGPQIGTRLAPVERKGVDLIFALDVSKSMDAEDVKPTRLEKAKFEIARIIRSLKGDRVGLIVYAGSSHFYLPLTTDYEAAQLFLEQVDTGMITTQGTALSAALNTAITGFQEENQKYKVVVLVSDGEDHEGQSVEIAHNASKTGMVIHTVGVGTLTGSLIPIKDDHGDRREYKRDRQGKLVTSMLNESILKEIADAGNGVYTRFDNRRGASVGLLKAVDQMEKKTLVTHVYSEFEDRYQIFGMMSLILWTAGFMYPTRKKVISKE